MTQILAGLVVMLAATTVVTAQSTGVSPEIEIPLFSEALAKELEPSEEPFTATYRCGNKVLGFVAAHHVFTAENSTIDAIRHAFADTKPSMVIIEGFPSAFGQNFAPILESVRRRESSNADSYAKGEAVFTASQALNRNVPFIGGEPTVLEEIDGLIAKGYRRDDVLFAFRLRGLGAARLSGAMPVGNASAFTATYEREARHIASMTRTDPGAEAQFIADYFRIVGVDPISDVDLPVRSNPGTENLLQRLARDNMRFRDEHLLATILGQLADHDRVLVVYGGSHWTTLSRALQSRLGKPAIRVEPVRR